jgi:SAM-dependent methyltransferase
MADEKALVTDLLGPYPPFRESLTVAPHSFAPVVTAVADRSRWGCVLAPASGRGLGVEAGAAPRPQRPVWGMPEALPFASGRLDLVVLVHTLEFTRSPYRILAEAERVLAPSGRLLVLTFNPLSLFGLVHPVLRRVRTTGPWPGRFLSALHVRRMLESTGLAPERSRYLFFRPPLERAGALRACRFLERLPARSRLPWGAVSCVQARKDEPGVTLLGPAFRAELGRSRKAGVPAYPSTIAANRKAPEP